MIYIHIAITTVDGRWDPKPVRVRKVFVEFVSLVLLFRVKITLSIIVVSFVLFLKSFFRKICIVSFHIPTESY